MLQLHLTSLSHFMFPLFAFFLPSSSLKQSRLFPSPSFFMSTVSWLTSFLWQWLTLKTLPHCPTHVNLYEEPSRGQTSLSQRCFLFHSAEDWEWAVMYENRSLYSDPVLFVLSLPLSVAIPVHPLTTCAHMKRYSTCMCIADVQRLCYNTAQFNYFSDNWLT